MMIAIN